MNSKVFLDTSFFKAFVDNKDSFHEESINILRKLEREEVQLITNNFILDETITLIRIKCGVERVRDFREAVANLGKLRIIRVTVVDEEKAWDWFWNDWSKLSFTDCVSFALMKRLNLSKAATFDDHFSRAGFEIEK